MECLKPLGDVLGGILKRDKLFLANINIRTAPSATFHTEPQRQSFSSLNVNVGKIFVWLGGRAYCVPQNSSESIQLASRLPFSKYTSTPHEDSDYPWKIGLFFAPGRINFLLWGRVSRLPQSLLA